MSDTSDPGSYDLDLAAASLAADSSDVQVLLRALVGRLRDALGARMTVQLAGGLFKRSDRLRTVEIQVGQDVFTAEVHGDAVQPSIGRLSGGIRIRNEEVPIGDWLRRLLGALEQEAAHSAATRQALEQIVIGGNP